MINSEKKRTQKIGVFDSGFGGIDILRGIVKKFPEYHYIYLGDNARVPYGNRSDEVIYEFTKQAVDFLFNKNCELIIFACNTASSTALRKIQQEYLPLKYQNKRVLGVLIPGAEEAGKVTKNNKVGVIATESTIKSNAFKIELEKINPKIKVFQKACPLLVQIVESGEQDSSETELILRSYLEPLMKNDIDTLILGCTHYGILEKHITKIVGKKVKIVSENRIIPQKLAIYLQKHREIEEKIEKSGIVEFYSTDITSKFETLGSKFFGKEIKAIKANLV